MRLYLKLKKIFTMSVISLLCFILLNISFGTEKIKPNADEKIELPSALPVPDVDKNLNSAFESNTPEYVVIHASDQVTFSSEIMASVASIYVQEGSRFNAGQVLLELDCRLQKADLEKATAEQMTAKQAYLSAKKLKEYGAISDYELIKAASDEKIANAEVNKLLAIVDNCTIKAPFSGSVSEVMVHSHESVKQGDPLLKIVNLENLQFQLMVPSCWLKWLHVGSKFSVAINETGQVISAQITKVNPQIEPVSQSVRLIATIIPSNPNLLPGMSGQAKFPDVLVKNCSQGDK